MCGLIGIINKKWDKTLSVPTESIFKQLVYVGALRGFDSTGIFKVTTDHKVEIVKKASHAGWFLSFKETQDLINNYYKDSFAVFAHNRKATVGLKDDDTAHPFQEDHITLMHNGTLNQWTRGQNTFSDSHFICKELAKENREFKPLESFQGAYALIWHNAQKQQINFCRNEERPLWIIEAKEWYVIVSEREMGEWILLRNGHDVLDAIEVDPGFIYKMSWKKDKLHLTKIKFTPAKKIHFNYSHNKSTNTGLRNLFEEDDTDSSGFGALVEKEQSKVITLPDRRREHSEYKPQSSPATSTQPNNYPVYNETEIIVVPFLAVRDAYTVGGHAKFVGFGIKEMRYEVTGRIHFPLSLAGQTAKWTVKEDEWSESILHQFCVGKYGYKNGPSDNSYISLLNVQKKDTSETTPKVAIISVQNPLNEDLESEIISALNEDIPNHLYNDEKELIETYNKYKITDSNWEDVCSLKCKQCKTDFDLETAEQAVVTEKLRGGNISYTYICPDCLDGYQTTIDNKKKKLSIRPVN